MEVISGSVGMQGKKVLRLGSRKIPVGMKVKTLYSIILHGMSLRQRAYWYQQEQLSSRTVLKITSNSLTDFVQDWSLPQQATRIVISPVQISSVKGKYPRIAPTAMKAITLKLLTFIFSRPRFSTIIRPIRRVPSDITPKRDSSMQIRIHTNVVLTEVDSSRMKLESASQATRTTKRTKLKPSRRQPCTWAQQSELMVVTEDSRGGAGVVLIHLYTTNWLNQGSTIYSDWLQVCPLEEKEPPIQDTTCWIGSRVSRWKAWPREASF